MTRPLRTQYPGAIYHVLNRGHRKERIFLEQRDREEFIFKLLKVKEKYHIKIHAYCLMHNHFHILMETAEPNLSKAMHDLECGYANWYRVKYQLVGSIFQNRFKSIIVEDDTYLLTLSSYIHLNPVRAGFVDNPEEYKWSSYQSYLHDINDEIVDKDRTLLLSNGLDNYIQIVRGFKDKHLEKEMIYGKNSIIGGDDFIVKIRASKPAASIIDTYAVPDLRKLRYLNDAEIANIVCEIFQCPVKQLSAKTQKNVERKVYLYLLRRYSSLKVKEIAFRNNMHYAAMTNLLGKFEKEIKNNKELETLINRCKSKIIGESI